MAASSRFSLRALKIIVLEYEKVKKDQIIFSQPTLEERVCKVENTALPYTVGPQIRR